MNALTKAYAAARKSIASAAFSVGNAMQYRQIRNITTDQPGLAAYRDSTIGAPNAALSLSVIWACVKLISDTIATLPLITYKNIAGRREVADQHPLYSILHDSPNADMTAAAFWRAVVAQICIRGNAYVLKSYNVLGELVALTPLDPALMCEPYRSATGEVRFDYSGPSGMKYYTATEVWHLKGFSTDGLVGLSPIQVGLMSVSAAKNADIAAARLYGNGMKPNAIIKMDRVLNPAQREQMKEAINKGVFDGDPGERLRLMEGGMEYQQLSLTPEQAQLLETRTFNVEDLSRWWQVNPAMIGHPGTASNFGTGREQIMLNFLQLTIRPILVDIEQGIKKSLLRPAERAKYFAEFSVEGLLRADSATRFEVYSKAVQNGLKTRNEVRALENDPSLPGGDDLTVQSNLIPLTLLGKITNTAQTAKAALKSWLGIEDKTDETQGQ